MMKSNLKNRNLFSEVVKSTFKRARSTELAAVGPCFESADRKTRRSLRAAERAEFNGSLTLRGDSSEAERDVCGHLTASRDCYDISQVKWTLRLLKAASARAVTPDTATAARERHRTKGSGASTSLERLIHVNPRASI